MQIDLFSEFETNTELFVSDYFFIRSDSILKPIGGALYDVKEDDDEVTVELMIRDDIHKVLLHTGLCFNTTVKWLDNYCSKWYGFERRYY